MTELVFSPTDFVAVFNQTLEMVYPSVRIQGEIFNMRISKGKWLYFDLKDEYSTVKFFGTVYILPGPLEDGMVVEVVGRPYLHPQFGFSVQVVSIGVKGEGSLGKAYDLLLAKLSKEGLFEPARKRTLPYAPENIAVISSKESAGYGDFKKIVNKRWPATKLKLYDVLVQGIDAPGQIVEALNLANQDTSHEVLVIIRGGGSKDDLAAFDHEQVVRSIAASRIPTMLAIGHERDESIAEMVADGRASTPSNAAEILVPDIKEEQALLRQKSMNLDIFSKNIVQSLSLELRQIMKDLRVGFVQKLDEASGFLLVSSKLLAAYDPSGPLRRGFALVKGQDGQLIRTKAAALKAKNVKIEFNDGQVEAMIG